MAPPEDLSMEYSLSACLGNQLGVVATHKCEHQILKKGANALRDLLLISQQMHSCGNCCEEKTAFELGGGLHSTEVAYFLPTQQPPV